MAVLEAVGLTHYFQGGRRHLFAPRDRLSAVADVSFSIDAGEAFGLVGESGCGKTTVARLVSAMSRPSQGSVFVEGTPFADPIPIERRAKVQVVSQDTLGALNPRLSIRRQMTEPLKIHNVYPQDTHDARCLTALSDVGLDHQVLELYPHQISGGQRQRILLARALLLDPSVLICDEAVSALDVSVQAHIVNLLTLLKREKHIAFLFISHDLRVVHHLCERIGVMYLGRLVEVGPCAEIFQQARHPYTRALMASLPTKEPKARGRMNSLSGEPPSPMNPPKGCRFHPRCGFAIPECLTRIPMLRNIDGHSVACHRAEEL
jgi:oligopeptide/dipeptide ABC transporter ATP-binding protein